jgi:hypothetical protein
MKVFEDMPSTKEEHAVNERVPRLASNPSPTSHPDFH